MFLYLIQHGEAMSKDQDPERPLSEKGQEDVKKMASYASQIGISVDEIRHSGKLRAEQTAEALSKSLKPSQGLTETDGLAPLDDPMIWVARLKERSKSTMLVGHLPHLGKLASLLLCGDGEKNVVAFKMAGIVCLQRDEEGQWSLQWMITLDIVRQ